MAEHYLTTVDVYHLNACIPGAAEPRPYTGKGEKSLTGHGRGLARLSGLDLDTEFAG
ncbi:MAG: hypothetical protein AB2598_00120 [Candidatus Thiodiazotropha sp.]